ncbi:MAG: hypothetical protein JRL30_25935 [Deltaproteobacteria bacterium]|nr:hypothetical protein [Deltaproteobacteria bacterium]
MATYRFFCVKNKHKFSLEIGGKAVNFNDPEYKKLRPLVNCPHPGCEATSKKAEIQDDFAPVEAGDKLEKRRAANLAATREARVASADAVRRGKKDMVRLDKPKGRGAGTPQDLQGTIEVSKGLIESLNSKRPKDYN